MHSLASDAVRRTLREARLKEILEHPLVRAMNPANKNFIQKHELTAALNPYAQSYDIHMFALTVQGFPHIKVVPAFEMLVEDFLSGALEGKDTIVLPSSGNTGDGGARLAPAFGVKRVIIVLPSDMPMSKVAILSSMGSHVEIVQTGNTMEKGREIAAALNAHLLDQYNHRMNWKSHFMHTGPAIRVLFGLCSGVISIALGSGGSIYGVGKALKAASPDVVIVGAEPMLGQDVPGARDKKRREAVVRSINLSHYVDVVHSISRKDSFVHARKLWSEVEPRPGPTGGLAYAALLAYLQETDLSKLIGGSVAFLCPDDGRFYAELFNTELRPEEGLITN